MKFLECARQTNISDKQLSARFYEIIITVYFFIINIFFFNEKSNNKARDLKFAKPSKTDLQEA